MINLNSKQFPELKACKRFRSKTKEHENETKRFRNLSAPDEEELERQITEFRIAARKIRAVPGEADLQLGCQEGRSVVSGDVYVPEQNTFRAMERIIPELVNQAYELAQRFRGVTYLLRYTQSVEFVEIER